MSSSLRGALDGTERYAFCGRTLGVRTLRPVADAGAAEEHVQRFASAHVTSVSA